MKNLLIGVHILAPTAPALIDDIVRAEELGIDVAWLTNGRPDSAAVLAAAAMRTSRIQMGTCIIPTYPRHPLALAQAAKAVAELAPGRFRLGVGPSHQLIMEQMWGIPFQKPLSHLREHLHLLKAALRQGGQIEFEGQFFKVRDSWGWGQPVDLQIMVSALRRKSYELAGELADGAISWVSPLPYIESVAIPTLSAGAARAGRTRPAMVMHTGLCVHENAAEVREAAKAQFAIYPQLPFYQRMFREAGFPEAAQGIMSEAMLDAIVISGGEARVTDQIRKIAATGVDEIICSIVAAGSDQTASTNRALRLLGQASRSE